MAIAYDNKTTFSASSTDPYTVSHTASGNNRLAVVSFSTNAAYTEVTGITYGGVSMTRIVGVTNGSLSSDIWYLVNPATGSQNVVFSGWGGTKEFAGSVSSYTGVDTLSAVDASNSNSGTDVQTIAVTVVANALLVDCFGDGENTPTEDAGQTLLNSRTGATPRHGSSYKLATTAGSYSMTWTDAGSASTTIAVASFKPFVATNYSLPVTVGAFTLTGITTPLSMAFRMVASVGSFVLTGVDTTFTWFRKWAFQDKNSSSMSNMSKNSSSWTNETKDSTSFSNQTKN